MHALCRPEFRLATLKRHAYARASSALYIVFFSTRSLLLKVWLLYTSGRLDHDNPISASSRLRTINAVGGADSQAPTAKVPSLPELLGGGGGISSFVLSAIIRWKPIPTPSITAKRIAHPMAPFRIALGPPRTASAPPVKNPAMMAFQGSSFLRTPLTAQSNVENMPPHTPKLPPRTGARAFIAVIAVGKDPNQFPAYK